MPVLLLSLLSFGKSGLGVVGAWLSRRSLGEIVGLIIASALVIDHLALLASHRHAAKVEAQLAKCTAHSSALDAEIKAISSAKNVQKVITKTRIQTVVKTIHDTDEIARKIEQAPPAPECKTNSAVMGADL